MKKPQFVLMLIALAASITLSALAAEPQPEKVRPDSPGNRSDQTTDPQTLSEGLARLEKVLGRYDADNQMEWSVPTEFERKHRPDPTESEILMAFKGVRLIGHPFRGPECVSFDEVWQWHREIYDLTEGGKKTLTRIQRSHNVTRYSLVLHEGVWFVQGSMLTNGVHNSMGKPAFQGTVKWHSNGFEILGNESIGRYYGAGGKFHLGTAHGSIRYTRMGEQLKITTRMQPYHLATDPKGNLLTSPDFKRSMGSSFELEYRSELNLPEKK